MRFALALVLLASTASAEEARWSTSRIHGSPEPPRPYVSEQVFTKITLSNALDMVPVPGLAQWLFVENGGKIWAVANDVNATKADLAIDLKALHAEVDHAYGVAFHPKFKENKQVFVTYTNGDKKDDGSRLSRFKVKQDTPLVIDPASEEILITWRSGGHNGAAVTFGNDGFLYLSTGDSEVPAPPDPLKTGQNFSDLLSSVLRLDVDKKDDGKAYAVPQDNPFVTTPGARPEIWCYGLRNPWKMSFDRPTGRLWCGDVGWELWEQIYLIKRGENYGWSAMEGNNPILPERKGPTPITPPIVTHSHSEAASITGGFVYHGKRLPELEGAYIYGDYETGNVWALWHDGSATKRHELIAHVPQKIVSFGQGEDGDVYFIHYNAVGTVHRLIVNPDKAQPSGFPTKLSETGLFSDVVKQTPAQGVLPFDVRAPMWADGAQAQRFAALPTGTIETKLWTDKKTGKQQSKATWPKEAVLAKTLTMRLDEHKPDSLVKVETQVLHFDGWAWNAYSYRWNEQGTDATLVGAAGDERVIELQSNNFPDGHLSYRYRFHSRTECLRCHTPWSGVALGFEPQQIVDPTPLLKAKLFDENYLKQSEARLIDPYASNEKLETRARSWMHANCAHCHRENGGGAVSMFLNAELELKDMHVLGEKATRGDFGIANAEILSPSVPWHSAMLHRIATQSTNRMPMIGAQLVDVKGLLLMEHWLMAMDRATTATEPTAAKYPLSVMRAPKGAGWITEDTDWLSLRNRSPRLLDQMMADAPSAAFIAYAIDSALLPLEDRARAIQLAATSSNAHIRGLFERFISASMRVETLGPSASVEKIAALAGDPLRGASLFNPNGKAAVCLTCHAINNNGRDFGPNLSQVGARLTPLQLVESLLKPSATITEGFAATTAKLKDGTSQTGFIVKREGDVLSIKTITGQVIDLKAEDVFSELVAPVSMMPEGLLQSFTAQEAADLVEYLSSLR